MPKTRRMAIPLAAPLMILTLVGIAGFQGYWMRRLYAEEKAQLARETDIAFRDVMYKLQMQHFGKDSFFLKHDLPPNLFLFNMLDSLRAQLADSPDRKLPLAVKRNLTISVQEFDDIDSSGARIQGRLLSEDTGITPHTIRYFHSGKGSEPPLSIRQIDSAYRIELAKSHITVAFRIEQIQGQPDQLSRQTQALPANNLQTNFLYVGLSKAYAYQATFGSPVRYILGRMVWPIAAGLLLLGFTALAFVVLYRNLQQQQRLAQYKNDFISNMTHELKTPMSTINVAIEALRHFDALADPKRTREYLDISAMELQRLSLLADKVLKLSQFENHEMEINFAVFDLQELAAEVMAGMRLSFEKAGAVVQLAANDGRFAVRADRAHLSSVISNLLDNALKYGKEAPVIAVQLWREDKMVLLSVTDNGIGIPVAYQGRIFEKFFRVPSGDRHNIKGYGLGLNYVHHIVHMHKGSIEVNSKESKGSTFTIKMPGA